MSAAGVKRPVPLSCILVVIFALSIGTVCQADAARTYVVKKGDNLNKISKKFGVSVEDIKEANNLDSIALRTGAKLKIPGRDPKVAKNGPRESDREAVKTSAKGRHTSAKREGTEHSSVSDVRHHTVKKGETLASIARDYSLSTTELCELNNIKKKSVRLKPGRKLLVDRTGPKTYIVKNSDTIWKIANRFDIAVEDLMEINELESPELKTGQKLVLEVWNRDMEPADSVKVSAAAELSKEIKTLEASKELEALSVKERLILFAKKMVNIPYRFGGSTFVGIDCSGYVQKVFGLLDVTLPRTAREQFHLGEPVSKESLSVGDLVFFKTYASFPSHVGIYLGNDLFIHASSKSKKVSIDSLDTPYYFKRFIGAKRLFDDELKEGPDQGDNG